MGRDTLIVVDTADSVSEKLGYRKHHGLLILFQVGDGVSEDNLCQSAGFHALCGRIAHHGMAAKCSYALGSELQKKVGGFGDSAGGIHDIVNENHILAFHVTDYGHLVYYIGFRACLVTKYQRYIEILGIAIGTFGSAYVGRGDYHVFEMQTLYPGNKDGRRVKMVNGNIEEPLDLIGMKVHGD